MGHSPSSPITSVHTSFDAKCPPTLRQLRVNLDSASRYEIFPDPRFGQLYSVVTFNLSRLCSTSMC
jgi:hypothetical protein